MDPDPDPEALKQIGMDPTDPEHWFRHRRKVLYIVYCIAIAVGLLKFSKRSKLISVTAVLPRETCRSLLLGKNARSNLFFNLLEDLGFTSILGNKYLPRNLSMKQLLPITLNLGT
jgi:hypothetical protein